MNPKLMYLPLFVLKKSWNFQDDGFFHLTLIFYSEVSHSHFVFLFPLLFVNSDCSITHLFRRAIVVLRYFVAKRYFRIL